MLKMCAQLRKCEPAAGFRLKVFAVGAVLVAVVACRVQAQDPVSVPSRQAVPTSVDELQELVARLIAERQTLQMEIARAQLELSTALRRVTELEQFIKDRDQYGTDFEKYTFYRERLEREERAKKAADARARREEAERKARETRDQKRAERDQSRIRDAELQARVESMRRAGFTIIGDAVGVGEMGTFYQTTEREEIRYIPSLDFWYVDRDRAIDYTRMRLSGSVMHAERDIRDLSIAIVFYNGRGGQIGQTTVRVDGARAGVPYPFTANLDMAANEPFASYTAYVMLFEPSLPGTPDPLLNPLPSPPAPAPAPAPAGVPKPETVPESEPNPDEAAPEDADPDEEIQQGDE